MVSHGKTRFRLNAHLNTKEKMTMNEIHLANTEAAAKVIGCSKSFLYRNWRKLRGARFLGENLRWDIGELLEWAKEQAESRRTMKRQNRNKKEKPQG